MLTDTVDILSMVMKGGPWAILLLVTTGLGYAYIRKDKECSDAYKMTVDQTTKYLDALKRLEIIVETLRDVLRKDSRR